MACSFPSSAETVDGWLDALNLARYKPTFAAAGVQVSQLPALTDDSLQAAGVAMIGHRKRMLQASKELVGHAMMPEPAPPAPFLPAAAGPSNDTQMMDVESPAWPPPPRRGTEGSFGGTAGTTTVPIIPPFPGGKNSSASSVGPVGGMLGSPATTAMPGGPAGMDTTSSGPPKSTPQQKANSTSSIYITSTLVKPDTDEVVFCIAAVIHDRIQQGEAQSSQDRHLFPFFSEDNNPLYAPPPDRDPRDGPASDSGSDSSMKRTRREIPTEDMIFHTIRSVYECARIPAECLIVSLVYIERLITVSGCPMLVTSWRPILLSSLILAQKVRHYPKLLLALALLLSPVLIPPSPPRSVLRALPTGLGRPLVAQHRL